MFWIINGLIFVGLLFLFFRRDFLSYFKGGKFWLTWLAVGIITLMDEFTSVFYAPSEAYRLIGAGAIIFIPLTAILVRFLTTRMVEIAEILQIHKFRGGGVYQFSYLVLGPVVSFVAVSSIMVDYVLTAAISTVSAVEYASSFLGFSQTVKITLALGMIWLVAGLNILGIRQNVRVTFGIFLATALIMINLILFGLLNFEGVNWLVIQQSAVQTFHSFTSGNFFTAYFYTVAAVSGCILAYSGVESVLQTAGLVEDWRVIGRAYLFLALSVGIVTPLVSVLALSQTGIDFAAHETDLITHYATLLRGPSFGITIAVMAIVTLLMAMNTAFVASGELIERVCHRYRFEWPIKTNRAASLYRVHIGNALFYSFIVLVTMGKQAMLAEMYAVGLVATFVINLLSLLIYRYSMGTKEISPYNVGRIGTLILFVLLLGVFLFLCYHKPYGFALWATVTAVCLVVGIIGSKRVRPENEQIERGETPMDILFYIAESSEKHVHIYFKRPFDSPQDKLYGCSLYVTLYSPRQTIPPRLGPHHFRIPFKRAGMRDNIEAILRLVLYEIPDRNITVYFGWPTSSWFDRLATGMMVFQFMALPKLFPNLNFKMEKFQGRPAEGLIPPQGP